MQKINISENEAPQRVDRFLCKYLNNAENSVVHRLLRKNIVRINGKRIKENAILQVGDVLGISLSQEQISQLQKEKPPVCVQKSNLNIVYEDDEILVVDKPAGLLTHPDKSEYQNTLATHVRTYLCHLCTKTFSPAPIQRLDKNTSGLVMFAKTYNSLQFYNEQMRNRKIEKKYLAIVEGRIEKSGEIKGFLEKDEKRNKVFLSQDSSENSKFVHTQYVIKDVKDDFSLLEITLCTGRSHQIRVSMEYVGHPIVGDKKYNARRRSEAALAASNAQSKYQLLHAYKITLASGQIFESKSERIFEFWAGI
ncbi:MAG: RluA family pseudouridine synthase [Chitinispirillales bacterium]|jgi:23S rRNA pseudouridine955/2504/2580 synthase|nr:RluA family pseudouridine synthase [Chitinispirillales bacterium]